MKILKFYTDTCMPCKVVTKMLDKIVKENSSVEVVPINALDDISSVDKYNICSTPTLVFIDETGEETGRIVGMTTEARIKENLL